MATLFAKASILQFYLRFPSSQLFRITTYFFMFVAVGYAGAQAIAWLYLCTPIQSYWDWTSHGTCVDIDAAYVVSAGLNVATDIVILVLPIWLLWPLRIRTLQKIGVTLILMTGGL